MFVVGGTQVSVAVPVLAGVTSPSSISSGSASTIAWSSANATSCSASRAWSGSQALSGSQSTGALTANATYTLTCTGPGGSAPQSTLVVHQCDGLHGLGCLVGC